MSHLSSIKNFLSGGPFLTGMVVGDCGGGHGVYVFAESVFIVRPEIGMAENCRNYSRGGSKDFQVKAA